MSFFHPDFCYLNTSHKVVTDSKGWNAGTCQRRSPFGINWRDFNLQKYRQGRVCSVRRLTFSIFFVANCVKKVSQLKVGKAAANYQVNLQDWTSGTSWQGIWGAQKNCFLPPKGLFQWMPNHCNAMHCISVGQPINWICTYIGPQCTRWQYTFSWCKSHHQLVHEAETDNLGWEKTQPQVWRMSTLNRTLRLERRPFLTTDKVYTIVYRYIHVCCIYPICMCMLYLCMCWQAKRVFIWYNHYSSATSGSFNWWKWHM